MKPQSSYTLSTPMHVGSENVTSSGSPSFGFGELIIMNPGSLKLAQSLSTVTIYSLSVEWNENPPNCCRSYSDIC